MLYPFILKHNFNLLFLANLFLIRKMSLRSNLGHLPKFLRNYYCASGPLLSVVVDDKTGVATINMQKPPVNSLNYEYLNELANTFQELEKNKSRGAIITSSSKTVFSAGLDMNELYKPEPERFKQLWSSLQQLWLNLYGSSYPTVAVINGHAPAAGCLLALACEYRIMVNNFTLGMNETQFGLLLRPWCIASLKNLIGPRQTELALTTGNLFKTDEAFKIGLVDEVVQSKEEGVERAVKLLGRFTRTPPQARALTKEFLRGSIIQDLVNTRQSEVDIQLNLVTSPVVVGRIEMYLKSVKHHHK